MTDYNAPQRDFTFLMHDVFDLPALWAAMPAFAEADGDLAGAVLEEGAKMVAGTIAPLRRLGDSEGARHTGDGVTMPSAYKAAFTDFADGGWTSLTSNPNYGGQGLPRSLSIMFEEMLWASDPAFTLVFALSTGSIKMFNLHGSDELKAKYMPDMISGNWTGTMCLTEPHAGSDLGIISTRADVNGDGSYNISGTKMFITAGDHDLTDNIIHFVLAKLPGAEAGTRGISLFLVPKFHVSDDGSPGARNSVTCGSIEHKMGIHASATCVMNFDGAKGWMVGAPGQGLKCMFAMMNDERLGIGLQGQAALAAAYQAASTYAKDRVQGRAPTGAVNPGGKADPIIVHPEVRRMLMELKSGSEAGRALVLYAASWLDRAAGTEDADERAKAQGLADLLTPLCKAYLSDLGFDGTVTAQQIFGGHGYVAEWGMEQWVRDTRIAQIYEGANGIISMDLFGRKALGTGGALIRSLAGEISTEIDAATDDSLSDMRTALENALATVLEVTDWAVQAAASDPELVSASAVAYQRMLGHLVFGFMWLRMARIAAAGSSQGSDFDAAKLVCANYFFARTLPELSLLADQVRLSSSGMMALPADDFG